MTSSLHPLCRFLSLTIATMVMIQIAAHSQTQASCQFKLFNLPQSTTSSPNAIDNDGTIVGLAVDLGGGERGFTRSGGGAVTFFSAPNATPTYRSYTYFTSRNSAGVKTGNYAENKTGAIQKGFILNGSNFTSIGFPQKVLATYANGINKWDSVAGYYIDAIGNGHAHGFKRSKNGSFTKINFPGAEQTFAQGINDGGAIVGSYESASQFHGFLYLNGEWATIDYPNARSTTLNGISNAGVIVGRSSASKHGTAFLYQNGAFKVITVPNSFSTNSNGISTDGLITGTTNLDGTANGSRGFIATCK